MTGHDDKWSPRRGRERRAKGDYAVGYGRPPREHQFRKGEPSRNPRGRPKGSGKSSPSARDILMEPITTIVNGRKQKLPFPHAWLQLIKQGALSFEPKASQILFQICKQLGIFDPKEVDRVFKITTSLPPLRPGEDRSYRIPPHLRDLGSSEIESPSCE
jgi:hypothetical protein